MRQLSFFQFILVAVQCTGWQCYELQFLQQLKSELRFEYVLLLGNSEHIWLKGLWQLPVSVIQIDEQFPHVDYNLSKHHSKNFLSIGFVGDDFPETLLEVIHLNLRMLNTVPILFVMRNQKMRVHTLLEWCWRHEFLNVQVIYENCEESGHIICSYTPFPILQFIERRLENTTLLFPPRMTDLHGYQLPIVVGGSAPRLIVYRGADGELIYTGFVGNLMKCIEQRFNCRLVQPHPFNESAIPPALQLIGAVRNGSAEFALSAIYPQRPFAGYTYPFELLSWCLMMPVPEEIPRSELYSMVFEWPAFLLTLLALVAISLVLGMALRLHGYRVRANEFFLHNSCLRGLLGQSFAEVFHAPPLVRGIYLEISVLGILIATWYNSYFSAYVTSAPLRPPFTSYDSIARSQTKVVVWTAEYRILLNYFSSMEKYESIFHLEPDYKQFIELRDSFNTKYGYMLPLEKWLLISQEQKVFSSPLFTMREELCFFRAIPIVFPIKENSIFQEALNRLILESLATGLINHWREMAFTEMIKAGQMSLVDRSKPKEFRAMQLMDLQQISQGFALMMAAAALVFLLELMWFYRQQIRDRAMKFVSTPLGVH
ncbi:uncharacterized protein LOC117899512 [Drosophila subobscura]|uniref:uncharacterized protein LOC117899512 n=1 Tax=Drosophila subobscura TaxID=7241 RepID=UPI00155A36FF|nr:uncharacterized protein LOC117899512 [Drosophila subobscura]